MKQRECPPSGHSLCYDVVQQARQEREYPINTPYQTHALQYLESGLGYPIPSMFPFEKSPPLKGWTGRDGRLPDRTQVETWMEFKSDSNILMRMAPDVIGIDVDDYDDKEGAATLRGIEHEHGELPWTHTSSARQLPSGIFWYRLDTFMDTDKMRDPGEHVEVIRFEHRYAVAPPSWHPTARRRYGWSEGVMPDRDDLGRLPLEWYVHLTRACDCFARERAERRAAMQRITNRSTGAAGKFEAERDLEKAVEALTMASEGGRNNLLSSIAGRFLLYDCVLNGVLTVNPTTDRLYTAAVEAGLEPREAERTIQSALDWAVREGESR